MRRKSAGFFEGATAVRSAWRCSRVRARSCVRARSRVWARSPAGWCGVKKVGFGFAGRAAGGGISSESVGAGVSAAPVLKVSTYLPNRFSVAPRVGRTERQEWLRSSYTACLTATARPFVRGSRKRAGYPSTVRRLPVQRGPQRREQLVAVCAGLMTKPHRPYYCRRRRRRRHWRLLLLLLNLRRLRQTLVAAAGQQDSPRPISSGLQTWASTLGTRRCRQTPRDPAHAVW